MDADYITKDEALEALVEADELSGYDYIKIRAAIENTPAANVRSVVKTRWKFDRGLCSQPEVVRSSEEFLSNFCPNCGADMRETSAEGGKNE